MTNLKKSYPAKWLCLAALLLCGCAQVADNCSDYNPYDPANQFCGADGAAYNKCGGKTYNTATQGCDASGAVREKCANGSVPEPNMQCGNGGEDTPHIHTWGGWIVMERASCEAQGLEINTCQTDNSHVLEQAIPQLSGTACEPTHTHSFGEWQTTAQPTCTMLGQQMRSCECGYSEIQQIPTDQSAHMWNNWITTTPATCSAAGQETIICMLNATHTDTRALPQLTGDDSHTYGGWIVTTAATCSAAGVETRTCSQNPGHINSREIPQLSGTACTPAHTHSFGEWHTTAQATCSAQGQEKRSCGCGADSVRTIASNDSHTYGDWIVTTPATCNALGETKRTCTLNSTHIETAKIPQTDSHSWGEPEITTPATCSAPGVLTRFCAINRAHTETLPIAQLSGADCQTENGGTFVDSRDNKTYKWVKIGTQTWMAENLNYDIPGVTTDVCYRNSPDSCAKYGRLYDWATAMNLASTCNSSTCASSVQSKHQGVCPTGWHIPSDAEWEILVKYVDPNATGNSSNNAGTKLKSKSGWNSGGNGTDDYGFSALPGGYVFFSLGFYDAGDHGHWWSATDSDTIYAWTRRMGYNLDFVNRFYYEKIDLRSVRCLMD